MNQLNLHMQRINEALGALGLGVQQNMLHQMNQNAHGPGRAQRFKYDQKAFPQLRLSSSAEENADIFRQWETSVRAAIEANGYAWPEVGHAIVAVLNHGESGRLAVFLRPKIAAGEIASVDELMDAMRIRCVGTAYRTKARARLNECIQEANESLQAYSIRFMDLFNHAFTPEERFHNEGMLMDGWIAGIRNERIQLELMQHRPRDYHDALDAAMRYEGIFEAHGHYRNRIRHGGRMQLPKLKQDQNRLPGDNTVRAMDVDAIGNHRSRRDGAKALRKSSKHAGKSSKKPNKERSKASGKKNYRDGKKNLRDVVCHRCKKKGHYRRDCRVKLPAVGCVNPDEEEDPPAADEVDVEEDETEEESSDSSSGSEFEYESGEEDSDEQGN